MKPSIVGKGTKGGEASEALFRGTPYSYLGDLGEGGMGAVFLVQHREMHAKFVAKVIHRELVQDKKMLDRFRLEAQSLGRLDHPHIVSVEGMGTTSDGRPFILLEYLRGSTLSEEIRKGELGVQFAVAYARQYLSALSAAHQARIVHRDFKPANIFITRSGAGTGVVKVLDFGLAKILPDAPTDAPSPLADPTTEGMIVGSPSYMSPEQSIGRDVDERGDLYSAALCFYKSLAGRGPFDHLRGDARRAAPFREKPEPPSRFSRDLIGARLDSVVLKALATEPRDRYRSADDLSFAIDAAVEVDRKQSRKQEEPQSKTGGLPIGIFAGALLLGAVITLFLQFLRAGQQ